jgi:hypothetical protein
MAKARSYREGWLTSLTIDALRDDAAELFLFRLGLRVDKNGVYFGDPQLLRAAAYPLQVPRRRLADVARFRDKLVGAGLLRLWNAADGRPYVQIVKWRQKTQNEQPLYPTPPGDPGEDGQESLDLREADPPGSDPEPKRKEGRGRAGAPLAPPRAQFSRRPSQPETEEAWLERLRTEWPELELEAELRRAQQNRRVQGKALERAWFERHWLAGCSPVVGAGAGSAGAKPAAAAIAEPAEWKMYLNRTYPDSAYSVGGDREAHRWADLPREVQAMMAGEMTHASPAGLRRAPGEPAGAVA